MARQFGKCKVDEEFPSEKVLQVQGKIPWYTDIANILAGSIELTMLSSHLRKILKREAFYYFWEDPQLFRVCADQVVRRCVDDKEGWKILEHYHVGLVGGHFLGSRTSKKVLDCGFYWLIIL